MKRPRSLQVYLVLWLSLLYLMVIAAVVAVFIYRTWATEESLRERELGSDASDVSRAIQRSVNRLPVLRLPTVLAKEYAESDENVFAVSTADGHLIDASNESFRRIVPRLPRPTDDEVYFHLDDIGARARNYYGMAITLDSEAGPVIVWVARAEGVDTLAETLVEDFAFDMAWVAPLLIVLTLGIGMFAIRRGLAPVRHVSQIAATIAPHNTSVRLPEAGVPSEVQPLVVAVNRAFDRLEKGFATQREFTANAAHELRTPLAIVTGALESMDSSEEVAKLRSDVARMNRLVEQLLSVARLDAIALDISGMVNLNEVAREIVSTMAPWAIAREKKIAFVASDNAVMVQGNEHAIATAIRNLVENAINHSPEQTEVIVNVAQPRTVSVTDEGPGVPLADRDRIFARFWRGKTSRSVGAGLGLAIVHEIMRLHAGRITIEDNPTGGTVFTLVFDN